MYSRVPGRRAGDALAAQPPTVEVAVDRCVGCLSCGAVCTAGALTRLPGAWAVQPHPEHCTGCRRCEQACPFGALHVQGAPRTRHRVILDELAAVLAASCPTGWGVTTAPPGFRAGPGLPSAVPDLAVVRATPPGPVAWLASPEPQVGLVVEVVSRQSRRADLGPRRDAYWRCGVPTFWTVDRRTGSVAVEWSTRPGWFDRWAAFTFG